MYDLVMTKQESGVLPERLQAAIELRDTTPAQLARDSGVSKATISQILGGERPNTPAVIVAKLARALMVSVDYLVGIADSPEPKSLGLSDNAVELARVANRLSGMRQRDLLKIASGYADDDQKTLEQTLDDIQDLIFRAADKMGRGEELNQFLEGRIKALLDDDLLIDEDSNDHDDDSSGDHEGNEGDDANGSEKPRNQ